MQTSSGVIPKLQLLQREFQDQPFRGMVCLVWPSGESLAKHTELLCTSLSLMVMPQHRVSSSYLFTMIRQLLQLLKWVCSVLSPALTVWALMLHVSLLLFSRVLQYINMKFQSNTITGTVSIGRTAQYPCNYTVELVS